MIATSITLPLTGADAEIAARTIAMEIRGGSLAQMRNVAWSLVHRQRREAHTLAQVALRPAQYSGWLASDPNYLTGMRRDWDSPDFRRAMRALLEVVDCDPVDDPTEGATHYLAKALTHWPDWAFEQLVHPPTGITQADRTRPRVPVLDDGAHLFFNNVA